MAPTTVISTPLPAELSAEKVIAALHNHELYLKLTNPDLVFFKLESGEPTIGTTCVYEIHSKGPQGESTFKQEFINRPDGVDVVATPKIPLGGSITIQAKWRVIDGNLKEDVEIEANFMIRKFSKGAIDKLAPGQHQQLLVEAAKA